MSLMDQIHALSANLWREIGIHPAAYPHPPHGLKELNHLQYCLRNSPLKGVTCEDETQTLTITKTIRVGDDVGPQIVVVNNDKVAKIFDPLYYKLLDVKRQSSTLRYDVVRDADKGFCAEASAYEEIHKFRDVFEGSFTPVYGSWTMALPVVYAGVPVSAVRHVRLIHMEYIEGPCMRSLQPSGLEKQQRLNIVFKAIEVDSKLQYYGIFIDFYLRPDNIILSGYNYGDPSLRVCLIDFTKSAVWESYQLSQVARVQAQRRFLRAPLSPVYRLRLGYSSEADWLLDRMGWLPDSIADARRLVWEHFRDSPDYLPVEWDPQSPVSVPVCREYYYRFDPP